MLLTFRCSRSSGISTVSPTFTDPCAANHLADPPRANLINRTDKYQVHVIHDIHDGTALISWCHSALQNFSTHVATSGSVSKVVWQGATLPQSQPSCLHSLRRRIPGPEGPGLDPGESAKSTELMSVALQLRPGWIKEANWRSVPRALLFRLYDSTATVKHPLDTLNTQGPSKLNES